MPEHQKVRTRSQNIQSIQDKRRTLQKDSTGAEEEMRKLQEEQKEERVVFLSNKVDKNKMAAAEMAAELQSLQAEEERRGSNASQTGDCCIGGLVATIYRLGSELSRGCVPKVQEMGAAQEQMPGREEGRRNSEDEQEQDKASQQLALSASSGCNEGTPASSLELDLPRVRGALGECGGAGKSGAAKDEPKRPLSNAPSRSPMDEEENVAVGDL